MRASFAFALIGLVLTLGQAASAQVPDGKELTNSIGMRLVRIEPGEFTMGSDKGEFDEKPGHRVTIRQPFLMSVHEVTNAQYEQFDPAHKKLRGKLGFSTKDDEAVIFVSWYDARNFCDWLSKKEGQPYRLPTEAEWEYACRAGTETQFNTGDALPAAGRKNNPDRVNYWSADWAWFPQRGEQSADLTVGAGFPANAWGLFGMHGNVEEWCLDWYGPYAGDAQKDPTGRDGADFRVTRGGSHNADTAFLRPSNRASTFPKDTSAYIGFRVVLAAAPTTPPLPRVPSAYQTNVLQKPRYDIAKGPDADVPYFVGPRPFVKIPRGSRGPLFSQNHDPALAFCPNGDLLAIWYTGSDEATRDLAQAASRLRFGNDAWDDASSFCVAADRNMSCPALFTDAASGTIYHFNGVGAAATWGNLALIMRTSTDNGVTWSEVQPIGPEHGAYGGRVSDHMPTSTAMRMGDGTLLVMCDAGSYTCIQYSTDNGKTWTEPTNKQAAGIHGAAVELRTDGKPNGTLAVWGRRGASGNTATPQSETRDKGVTWTIKDSVFGDMGVNRRCTVLRLKDGPILMAHSCGVVRTKNRPNAGWAQWGAKWPWEVTDAAKQKRTINGLFVALSYDEGQTWPVKRILTPNGPEREVETLYHRYFLMDTTHGEPMGYLASCQGQDAVIHVITSFNEYAFNRKWIETPMPAAGSPVAAITATPVAGKAPLTVSFAASLDKDDAGYTYTWHFNDDTTTQGKAQTHAFAKPGRHVVTLIVSDESGHWDTQSATILVAGD